MNKKLIKSQISNYNTYLMIRSDLKNLAENVFLINNLPACIDLSYINRCLVEKTAIAYFIDKDIGLLALPFTINGGLDLYGRPQEIIVKGENGYNAKLNKDEFVIMYDNLGHVPMMKYVKQYSERISNCIRIEDVNLSQQKTPRIIKCSEEQKKTLQNLIDNVEGNIETILAYDGLELNDIEVLMNPVPFVADKVDEMKTRYMNEFLRIIGVANVSFQKKERNIKDEILAQQGGTVASRFSRYEARKRAIEEINKKFKNVKLNDGTVTFTEDITVEYYDGLPSMVNDTNEKIDIKEGDSNV